MQDSTSLMEQVKSDAGNVMLYVYAGEVLHVLHSMPFIYPDTITAVHEACPKVLLCHV